MHSFLVITISKNFADLLLSMVPGFLVPLEAWREATPLNRKDLLLLQSGTQNALK
jgi:hypothetical protein